jgi:nitroreductase/NAD-dependent dihydropyrimidine dehydrogenase PreA subunit
MNRSLFENRRYPPTKFARFVVDPEKCDACQRCVETCPGQLLEMNDKLPVNKHERGASPLGCIGCKNCLAVCQKGAIDVRGHYHVEEGFYRTELGPPSLPNPLGAPESPPFEAIEAELTPVERVIYKRRSIRLFKKKAVPEALVRRVLESARFAPSAGNGQPWSFVVVNDRALLDEMAVAIEKRCRPLARLYLRNQASRAREGLKSLAINALSRLSPNNFDQRLAHGIDTFASNEKYDVFLNAPVLILVLGDTRGISEPVIDCALAAHNMVLTAHSLGLGSCYIGFTKLLATLPELREKLGIRWPYRVMTSVVVGYPRTQIDRAVARERPRVTWFPADRSGPWVEE